MNCEEALNRYMALDKHEAVPVAVTFHILRCKKCRAIVRALTKTSSIYSASVSNNSVDINNELTKKTMAKIVEVVPELLSSQTQKYSLPQVSILPWVITGLAMIIGLIAVPFTFIGKWASNNFHLGFI